MFIRFLFLCICIFLPLVHCYCYSKSSQTWICNNRSRIDDYQTILTNEKFENFFLKNYELTVLKIDQYPSTLRLFNASNNQFERITITSKNRNQSNLRQLILQSNNIRYFNMENIVLPQTLEIISLANNRLEILDARMFLSLKNLTKLNLRNNLLKRILPQLVLNRIVRLNNNPLECQCTPDFYRIICQNSTNLKQPIVS
jgi:Leucine-rich repeat (LRR) protein